MGRPDYVGHAVKPEELEPRQLLYHVKYVLQRLITHCCGRLALVAPAYRGAQGDAYHLGPPGPLDVPHEVQHLPPGYDVHGRIMKHQNVYIAHIEPLKRPAEGRLQVAYVEVRPYAAAPVEVKAYLGQDYNVVNLRAKSL
ncbi:hypothetical protein SE86_06180 [Acidilobus sp. 7A]|nr:hypothetical protein SE86_06180 [Acidilobus sp. 7A]